MTYLKIDERIGLITIPRAASSSIQNTVGGSIVDEEAFKKLPVRIAFMRNPYSRIESAYKMYLRHNPHGYEVSEFKYFVLNVCLERPNDPHVSPQIDFCRYAEEVICWDFPLLAKVLDIPGFKWDGASPELPCLWDDNAYNVFTETYLHDIILWTTNIKKTS